MILEYISNFCWTWISEYFSDLSLTCEVEIWAMVFWRLVHVLFPLSLSPTQPHPATQSYTFALRSSLHGLHFEFRHIRICQKHLTIVFFSTWRKCLTFFQHYLHFLPSLMNLRTGDQGWNMFLQLPFFFEYAL